MILPPDIAYRWVSEDPAAVEERRAVLSVAERERLHTFKHHRRQMGFTLGRYAARTLVSEQLGVPPEQVSLHVSEDGCVETKQANLILSIAHSGTSAVAAVGARALGIDLEQIVPRRDDLYRFLLHPDEYYLLDALPMERNEIQLLCWTLKEATLKAMRTGFRVSPKKLRLEIDPIEQMALIRTKERSWHARYEQRDGYFCALAFAERDR